MTECPVCGSEYEPPDLDVDLNSGTVIVSGEPVKVTGRMAEIMSVLLETFPHGLTRDRLIMKVWGAEGGPESNSLTVHLVWLRKVLAGSGWTICRFPRGRPIKLVQDSQDMRDMRQYRAA